MKYSFTDFWKSVQIAVHSVFYACALLRNMTGKHWKFMKGHQISKKASNFFSVPAHQLPVVISLQNLNRIPFALHSSDSRRRARSRRADLFVGCLCKDLQNCCIIDRVAFVRFFPLKFFFTFLASHSIAYFNFIRERSPYLEEYGRREDFRIDHLG